MKVLVALSGGIDSAVSLALALRRWPMVEAVHMLNWDGRIEDAPSCKNDFEVALRVANTLKVPLHRANFTREYWNDVFVPMLDSYARGKTPNPDIHCNKLVKMGALRRWAQKNRFDLLVTGHYAKIIEMDNSLRLARAKCLSKDQSYFLAEVKDLDGLSFPIGDFESKEQVRRLAADHNLSFLLGKPESMGICFVGKRKSFATFISDFLPSQQEQQQRVLFDLDEHKLLDQGISFTPTIGQAIGVSGLKCKYYCVLKTQDTIYVSSSRENKHLRPRNILIRTNDKIEDAQPYYYSCSIRSSEKVGIQAQLTKISNDVYLVRAKVAPFIAPAPGQFAVIYLNDQIIVMSGEIIDSF